MSADRLQYNEVEKIVFARITDAMNYMVAKYGLRGEVYVMITSDQNIGSNLFVSPFRVSSVDSQGAFKADQLHPTAYLVAGITSAQQIEKISAQHPGVPFILDEKTAQSLSNDSQRPAVLIAYDENHCLLTGLNARGIDVFISGNVETLIETGNLRITKPAS